MPASCTRIATGLLGATLLVAVLSCSRTETAKSQPPTLLPDSIVVQIRQLINQGYYQLDSAKLEEAVASFAQVSRLLPNGLVGEYHTACVYARTGNKEQAFDYLNRLIDSGFDNSQQLADDTDFESLKDDPRFESVLERAIANFSKSSAALSQGMPEFDTPPEYFTTEEEFNEWVDRQTRTFRSQSRFWRAGDALLAQIDFSARRLACLREFRKDDTAFDYGLERVRALVRLKSQHETGWGEVSDLIVRETDAYCQRNPTGVGRNEADFLAGLALTLKHPELSEERVEEFRLAETRLDKVEQGTPYYGAALALKIINRMKTPGVNADTVGKELTAVLEQFPDNESVYRVVSIQLHNQAPLYLWPLQLDKPDLDNKKVSLSDYRGKVLLIDFWATWCPPCRAELPNLLEVYREYHPKGMEIVSISLDYSEDVTPEAYRQWIDSAGMNWRHTYDGAAWDTELVRRFFVSSIPAPFLVAKDGSLAAWGDDLRGEYLEVSIKSALGI